MDIGKYRMKMKSDLAVRYFHILQNTKIEYWI